MFAILDPQRRRALLAIDRLGIQPLCYAAGGGGGVFGTTTDAVASHPAVTTTISPQALHNYLAFYRIFAPLTIYSEQRKLLPAQFVLIDGDVTRTEFYWRVPYEDRAADAAYLTRELFDRLRTAVRTAAAEPEQCRVGAFLSGGLDSSTVAGCLGEVAAAPVQAFTIGFDCPGYDETEYARAAADHFGAKHHIYTVTPSDVVELLPRVAEVYDEPFGNSSAIPTYYCARLAREHGIELLLAGDGGDEIFAGNVIYARMKLLKSYEQLPVALRRYLVEPLVSRLPSNSALAEKARRNVARANAPMPDLSVEADLRLATAIHQAMAPDLAAEVDPLQPLAILRDVYERTPTQSLVQRLMHMDLQTVLADNDLRKVNRMCAYAGVRVRYPMLDEGVVELAARVPPDMQIKGTKLRHFYRQAMQDFLPPKVLKKRKHGFGLPFGQWLKEHRPLRDLARDAVAAARARGLLDRGFVDRIVAEHERHDDPHFAGPIWDIAVLELWLQGKPPGWAAFSD